MRILITMFTFGLGGTESYSVTVAEELERLGHVVHLHAVHLGPGGAELAAARGLRLTAGDHQLGDLADIDAAIAQDVGSGYLLAGRPGLPRIFVVHGLAPFETPLAGGPGTVVPVVVLNDRMLARVQALAARPPAVRLRQPIDLDRFRPMGPNRRRARRVLALSNSIADDRLAMLESACAALGLELVRIGGAERSTTAPEQAIVEADVVVGYGRSVLEAMAMGKAAYVWERAGGDGWVTPESYPALEADGFSGGATDAVIDPERLRADLSAYTPELGVLGHDLVRNHHLANRHVEQLLELLDSAPDTGPAEGETVEAMALLSRAQTRALAHAHGLEVEISRQLEVAAAERAGRLSAEARLRGVEASRSWRLTAPLRSLSTLRRARRR